MVTVRAWLACALGASAPLSLAACADGSPARGGDAALDAALDARAMEAGPGPALCPGPVVEDLAIVGSPLEPALGPGARFEGDNLDAPEELGASLQPGSLACEFRAVAQRLFRYTLRAEGALRVSTNNPGTDTSFDSTLFVAPYPCALPLRVFACNDDDPTAPPEPHVTASLVTTGVLPAGTTVLIAVSGFYPAAGAGQAPNPDGVRGQFVLTARELPAVPVGGACTLNDANRVCSAGSNCVSPRTGGTQGACVRDGTRAGSRCRAATMDGASRCDDGLRCDEENSLCFTPAREGEACERSLGFNGGAQTRARCEAGLSCVTSVRGSLAGNCARVGAALFAECGAGGMCGEAADGTGALACVNGRCQRLLRDAAARCSIAEDACPRATSCVADVPGAAVGACARDGALAAACRPGLSECDEGLACILESDTGARRCKTVGRIAGASCGPNGVCSYETPCVAADLARPGAGVCAVPGSAGGSCMAGACEAGATCMGVSARSSGRCVRVSSAGEGCDVAVRFAQCATGLSCVAEATGATGLCRAAGTVAGAACRAVMGTRARCDAGLACSGDGSAALCARTATAVGAACDARYGTVRCPEGTGCLANSLASGVCAPRVTAPAAGVPALPTLPGLRALPGAPALVRGALERYGLDCYRVTAGPAPGRPLFAQVTGAEGRCTEDLALDVYHRSEQGRRWRWIGTSTEAGPGGCPRIDGREAGFRWAVLGAGTGTEGGGDGASEAVVCVRQDGDRRAVGAYELSAMAAAEGGGG